MSAAAAERVADFLGFELPNDSSVQQARLAALAAGLTGEATPTSLVSFNSSGVLAVVGPLPSALAVAEDLREVDACLIVATDGGDPGKTEIRDIGGRSIPIVYGKPTAIAGFLGKFEITIVRDESEIDLAKAMELPGGAVDVVLDL
ncbi:MAG: hypothetical protein VX249_00575, partial [Pseudomonadota bacterium]|nr:hypothetical protein [Pseudomonadota bacterium]